MTVTVSASVSATYPPTVLVDVASSPSVSAPLKVFRVHDDGSRHRVLTSGRAVLVGSWSGYDYHAPLNRTFTYVAAAEGEAESAESSPLFLPSDVFWLIHPTDPDLSCPLDVVVKLGARKKKSNITTFRILNSSSVVARTDSRRGPESGDLVVLADDATQADALDALLADGGPILLNPQHTDRVPWMWVAPGDTTTEPPGGYWRTAYRQISFPFEECRAPDADVVPQWTLDDVAAEFADLAEVTATYTDLRALQLDIRNP